MCVHQNITFVEVFELLKFQNHRFRKFKICVIYKYGSSAYAKLKTLEIGFYI